MEDSLLNFDPDVVSYIQNCKCIHAKIVRRIFSSTDRSYNVFDMDVTGDGMAEEMAARSVIRARNKVAGIFRCEPGTPLPSVRKTKKYELSGHWVRHKTYGWQFEITSFKNSRLKSDFEMYARREAIKADKFL